MSILARLVSFGRLLVASLAFASASAHAQLVFTASPAIVTPGSTVTAAWSNLSNPTTNDWIGLYVPGSANTAYLAWRYTTGGASGSVPFTIPSNLTPGTYELRISHWNISIVGSSNSFGVHNNVATGTVTLNSAALSGVTLTASSGGLCTQSNGSGQYSCAAPSGWSGTVTPSLTNYGFTPASRTYSNVTSTQTAQDYGAAPVHYVSGTVTSGGSPLSGVAFSASNGGSCTSSNGSGQYTCTVPQGWSGSVTPSLSGYGFSPASRSYSALSGNETAQDYTGAAIQNVSGTVSLGGSPASGISFSAGSGTSCTSSNGSGQYTCTVPNGWSGTVTPTLSGHIFSPASRSYSNVTATQSSQDYAAIPTYQVSGTVTASSQPLAGVAFGAGSGNPCTQSNTSGQYSCTVPHGWSGSITPSVAGYTFTPASISLSNVTASQTGQDFTAAVNPSTQAVYYIHVDHLNTPRLVANQQQQAVWRWDQAEPFGVNVPDENPSSLGTFVMPLRFPGQHDDKETNLYYNDFRDFDASLGRYVEADPIGLGGEDVNLYAYVTNNPLSWIDPLGLANVNPNDPLRAGGGGGFGRSLVGGARLGSGNCCPSPQGVGNSGLRPKPINLPSSSRITIDMQHVRSGHMAGGSRITSDSQKTVFPTGMTQAQVEKAILDAYKNCSRIRTQGDQVLVRGTSRDGLTIEMWVNTQTRTIMTAYPVY